MRLEMNWVAWTILIFLVVHYLLQRIASHLNLGAISDTIPEALKDRYPPDAYRRAQAYLRTTSRFGQVVATVDLAVLLTFWFGGGFALVDEWSRTLAGGPVLTGLAFIGALALLKAVVGQPFSLYATFVIEQRFGFNQTTWGTWVSDRLKGVLLAVLLGAPLLSGVLALFHYCGTTAWLWCWLLVTLFSLVVQWIAPTWILPLFNRFVPLAAGQLKDAVTAYAASIGFPLRDIVVMDGSKRSTKSNAFFTGFGGNRRIVLFDTLVDRHAPDELLAVLAHEMGHYRLRHIVKMMVAGIMQTGLLLYCLAMVIHSPDLYAAFGIDRPSVHVGLVVFGLLTVPLDLFLGLFMQALSRRHEFAADRFAVRTTGRVQPMIEALKTLSVDNLSNLSPHPFYVLLNYSHPPVLQRIQALEREREAMDAESQRTAVREEPPETGPSPAGG